MSNSKTSTKTTTPLCCGCRKAASQFQTSPNTFHCKSCFVYYVINKFRKSFHSTFIEPQLIMSSKSKGSDHNVHSTPVRICVGYSGGDNSRALLRLFQCLQTGENGLLPNFEKSNIKPNSPTIQISKNQLKKQRKKSKKVKLPLNIHVSAVFIDIQNLLSPNQRKPVNIPEHLKLVQKYYPNNFQVYYCFAGNGNNILTLQKPESPILTDLPTKTLISNPSIFKNISKTSKTSPKPTLKDEILQLYIKATLLACCKHLGCSYLALGRTNSYYSAETFNWLSQGRGHLMPMFVSRSLILVASDSLDSVNCCNSKTSNQIVSTETTSSSSSTHPSGGSTKACFGNDHIFQHPIIIKSPLKILFSNFSFLNSVEKIPPNNFHAAKINQIPICSIIQPCVDLSHYQLSMFSKIFSLPTVFIASQTTGMAPGGDLGTRGSSLGHISHSFLQYVASDSPSAPSSLLRTVEKLDSKPCIVLGQSYSWCVGCGICENQLDTDHLCHSCQFFFH